MVYRYTKLRLRRRIRNQKKTIASASEQASDEFERKVVRRWRNLRDVRRFVIGWLVLVGFLILGVFLQGRELSTYYLSEQPVPGGTFREGVVGQISNMNPIFAVNQADRAAAALQFNPLFTYDDEGRLVGDLAIGYEKSKDGLVYTVNLRADVKWHDGQVFDADDVVFTYEAIQHPDTRSFLNVAWRDVLVEKAEQFKVKFTLPNEFTPFPHSLAQGGIIPEHILGSVDPSQLRGHSFNNLSPVGTGPFVFNELLADTSPDSDGDQLRLDANRSYFKGDVQLDHFALTTFRDREVMVNRFLEGELAAIGGLTTDDRELLFDDLNSTWYDLPLNNGVFVFFNNSKPMLKDKNVRLALSRAIDQVAVNQILQNRFAPLDSPLLPEHLGYSEKLVQVSNSQKTARELLNKAGWKFKKGSKNDGFRYKDGERLAIQLLTQNSDDFPDVAREIARQWSEIGIEANVIAVNEGDIQQNNIAPHNYQALLFGISLGSDPDQFVYWHSSQKEVNGFNLSEVQDDVMDEALESGRTRANPDLREAKYNTFLERWTQLAPAYALYRPSYTYTQRDIAFGFVPASSINTPEQRYHNVQNWRVNTALDVKPY